MEYHGACQQPNGADAMTHKEDAYSQEFFKEFQATRKKVRGKQDSWNCVMDAYTYLNTFEGVDYIDHALHINLTGDEADTLGGKYYLLIERSEWISDDLAELEYELFKFISDEGYYISKAGKF